MIDELRTTKQKWQKDFKDLTYSQKKTKKIVEPIKEIPKE